ncbi:MAG: HlyD family secretion protein [Bacteroidota bacterium]
MLTISNQPILREEQLDQYRSYRRLTDNKPPDRFRKIVLGLTVAFVLFTFLPWTQNIRSRGQITALRPDQRPQTLQSVIGGRIEHWYVAEGDTVRKGDTLLHISEIKEDYFDTLLLDNTRRQIQAGASTVGSYEEKINALRAQLKALDATRLNKIKQARIQLAQTRLKVNSDSSELQAALTQENITQQQFKRSRELYEGGLQPLTEYEARRQRAQEAEARRITVENRVLASRNAILDAEMELTTLENEFQEKIAKVSSELFETETALFKSRASLDKLNNQYANYAVRSGLYWLLAPQDGVITQARKTGLGELVNAGEEIVSIAPIHPSLAVEMYVRPVDIPLLHKKQKVRFLFDGWPAVVFSGWPGISFGTFGGKVIAVDPFTSKNGLYRVLVSPDPDDKPWPPALRVGSGASGIALLNDVPIWYELWRQLNGFPPDYYEMKEAPAEKKPA